MKIKTLQATNGLIPVVVQDAKTKRVLMLAYANRAALRRTQKTGLAWFWSRSRKRLWQKGETSGNVLRVKKIFLDCDADTLLFLVSPAGPACHTGKTSCFHIPAVSALSLHGTRIPALNAGTTRARL